MKNYLIIATIILINLLSGCTTKIVISNSTSPILIKQNGTFVTQNQFIDLLNGKLVKHRNSGNLNDYYIPPNLIVIEGQNVILFKK